MKYRFYSHYTYIEPDILLKNYIVEMDDEHHIVNLFPFKKEIERTEFYSGILVFIEDKNPLLEISFDKIKKIDLKEKDIILDSERKYKMLHFENFIK